MFKVIEWYRYSFQVNAKRSEDSELTQYMRSFDEYTWNLLVLYFGGCLSSKTRSKLP